MGCLSNQLGSRLYGKKQRLFDGSGTQVWHVIRRISPHQAMFPPLAARCSPSFSNLTSRIYQIDLTPKLSRYLSLGRRRLTSVLFRISAIQNLEISNTSCQTQWYRSNFRRPTLYHLEQALLDFPRRSQHTQTLLGLSRPQSLF